MPGKIVNFDQVLAKHSLFAGIHYQTKELSKDSMDCLLEKFSSMGFDVTDPELVADLKTCITIFEAIRDKHNGTPNTNIALIEYVKNETDKEV